MNKMTKAIKFLLVISILLMLTVPAISFAQGLVPCNTVRNPEPCEFKHFTTLINKVINFILFYMAVPIAAIMFVYAGVLLVTSGGSTESRGKAKKIFTSVLIGIVLAAAAWLIVKTLLSIVHYRDIGRFF